jgi:hypothetical protein
MVARGGGCGSRRGLAGLRSRGGGSQGLILSPVRRVPRPLPGRSAGPQVPGGDLERVQRSSRFPAAAPRHPADFGGGLLPPQGGRSVLGLTAAVPSKYFVECRPISLRAALSGRPTKYPPSRFGGWARSRRKAASAFSGPRRADNRLHRRVQPLLRMPSAYSVQVARPAQTLRVAVTEERYPADQILHGSRQRPGRPAAAVSA